MGDTGETAADRPIRRPQRRLLELSLLSLIAVALVLVATLHLPIANIKVERFDNARLTLRHSGGVLLLPRGTPLIIAPDRGEPIAVTADMLIDGIDASGSRADKTAWWKERNRIADVFRSGPISIRLPDGKALTGSIRARELRDLTGGFWAALATGFAALLCGLWILVIRPRSNSARTFAIMSLGLFGAGCTLAAGYDPLLLGETYRLLMLLNHACVQIFAAAILMLFCRFPTPMVGWRWTWAIGAAAAAVVVADVADLAADSIAMVFAAIAVEFVLFLALLMSQGIATRNDPIGGAAMRLIASSAVLSSTLFVGAVILPMLFHGAPIVSEPLALPLLLVIYGGLGAAIARTRLFTFDGWALGMLLSVCAAIAVTAIDLAILALVAESRGLALPVAIVAVGLVYLPLRRALGRRAEARRNAKLRLGLRMAGAMAFALDAEMRAERWRHALAAMFDPLEISLDPQPASEPMLGDDGASVRLPPIGDVAGLVLRYAQRGARDFDDMDLVQVREMIEVIETLIGARDAYVRGMAKERARIARDLHDDVSARLLTSLQRADQDAMRKDVRHAMADIRAIISGDGGTHRMLDDVIADIRFETANRLEAHGVALTWPIVVSVSGERTIDDATARHLTSVLRELTSNVIRHSGALNVWIDIAITADRLALRMRDDGRGFDPEKDWGNGLLNSARRASLMNGSFSIQPGDAGAVVDLEVSLGTQHPPAERQAV